MFEHDYYIKVHYGRDERKPRRIYLLTDYIECALLEDVSCGIIDPCGDVAELIACGCSGDHGVAVVRHDTRLIGSEDELTVVRHIAGVSVVVVCRLVIVAGVVATSILVGSAQKPLRPRPPGSPRQYGRENELATSRGSQEVRDAEFEVFGGSACSCESFGDLSGVDVEVGVFSGRSETEDFSE